MNNSKNERFKRIASARTNKILEQIRLLGNCANKNNYSYSEEEVKKIFAAIESELKATKSKFNDNHGKEKFSL
jgi:ABC-type Fe3+-hydroxamate transport system substrate-binding protein